MKVNTHTTKLFGETSKLNLMEFDKNDRTQWKKLFDNWDVLNTGMKNYKARGINMPEGISEVAFCLYSGSRRFVSVVNGKTSASFDTYNLDTQRAEQVKACSVKSDLTSFGPKSKWDDLYFMDFYNDGNLDGSFNLYLIPNEMIYKTMVNKDESFTDQQNQKRRPRFSIKEKIIQEQNLKPIATNVKVWL